MGSLWIEELGDRVLGDRECLGIRELGERGALGWGSLEIGKPADRGAWNQAQQFIIV